MEAATAGRVPGKRAGRSPARETLRWIALILLTLLYVAPIAWMLLTAFKTEEESALTPPTLLPSEWSREALDTIFSTSSQTPVIRWFFNSMIAALGNALLVLLTAAPAAYALARMEFRGKRLVFAAIVATLFVPPIIFLAPNYEIVEALGWLDTLAAVIFPAAASAFGVFFLRQFFLGLPHELEEAAILDGCGHVRIFWQIFLPQSGPMLAACMVLTFTAAWGDFIAPSLLLSDDTTTLAVIMTRGYVNEQGFPVQNLLAAGSTMFILPVLLMFLFFQRFFVQGFSTSGLK